MVVASAWEPVCKNCERFAQYRPEVPVNFSVAIRPPSNSYADEAVAAHARLLELVDQLEELPDRPGQRVHALFAQLYVYDTEHWIERFSHLDDDDGVFERFCSRFLDAYLEALSSCLSGQQLPSQSPWRTYLRLTRSAQVRGSPWRHLLILSAGARAHIFGDIGPSFVQAARELSNEKGRCIKLRRYTEFFLDDANKRVIENAALDMIDHHLHAQSGHRRALLRAFRWVFPRTSWIWWTVMQRWRRHSWNVALRELGEA